MKKTLLTAFLALIATLSARATNFKFTHEGQTLTYTILDETEKTVKTKDGPYDYYIGGYSSGNSVSGTLIIPEKVTYNDVEYTVTSIGTFAFYYCSGLTSVTIPNSVTSIGSYAFAGCSGLTKAEFASIEALCSISFQNSFSNPLYYAKNLWINGEEIKDLVIPESVTSIGNYAFYGCSGLTSVTIPNSVTSIGSYAFEDCSGLTSVTIPNSVTSIGSGAFLDCFRLTSVTIGNSVTSIGTSAFRGCSGLTSVSIPNSVTSIGDNAFDGCSGLTSVTIGNSVTSIGSYAFDGCSGLKKVAKPEGLSYSFSTDLYLLNYDKRNNYASDEGFIFSNDNTQLLFAPCSITEYTIPNSVTSIGYYAFRGCSGLTSVTIPNSVTKIGNYAFYSCFGLTEILVEQGSNYFSSIEGVLFDKSATSIVAFPADKKDVSYEIPNSVTSIGYSAFSGCSRLTSVSIPNSVTSIGYAAFEGCSGLTSVTIPNSVTSIGKEAFYGCSGLKKVAKPEGLSYSFSTDLYLLNYDKDNNYASDEGFIFSNDNTQLLFAPCSITEYTIPNSVTSIGDYAFYDCSGLTSVTIPESVTSIGYKAFRGCSGLTSVTIPNSVTSIGDYAFARCSGLTSVTIPNSVNSIGDGAFSLCSGLTSVTIPNSVTSIGTYAFNFCSGLTSVTIPNSVTSISDYAFRGCSGLTSVTIPESVTSIGKEAFYGCSRLTSVSIPGSVTIIGSEAFSRCSGLTSITIPNAVETIGDNAFYNCSGLRSAILGTGLKSVSSTAFANSGLVKIAKPATLETSFDESILTIDYDDFDSRIGDDGCIYTRNRRAIYFAHADLTDDYQMPSNVRTIKDNAFALCSDLTYMIVPDTVTTIGASAFSGCSGLTFLSLPEAIDSIGENVWKGCEAITDIEYKANIPVEAPNNIFMPRVYDNATLHVPANRVDIYMDTDPWSFFYDITDDEYVMGIEDVETDRPADGIDMTEPYDVYNINGVYLGQSVEGLAPGFYILRQGPAAKKIAIR